MIHKSAADLAIGQSDVYDSFHSMGATALSSRHAAIADPREATSLSGGASCDMGPAITAHIVSAGEWDEAVAGFDGICQEQTWTFGHLRWPSLHHEPMVFMHDGEIVGGSLMKIQRLPLGVGSVAISKWGPMLRHADRPDRTAIYRGMIAAMVSEYADKRGLMLSILPRAAASSDNDEFDTLTSLGFKAGSNAPFPNRYLVNLSIDEVAQRASLHQKWRYHLRKSEKAGLTFEHAGPERIGDFARIYDAMSTRKKFPDYSAYQTVPDMFDLPERLRPELFFVKQDDDYVAGAIVFKAGDTATYLYGATTDRALPLRAGYLLHWHIIRWLTENTRAKWYDLGGTDGFLGLHQFKKGMVGDAGIISALPPMANYAARKWPFLVGTTAFAARDIVLGLRQRLFLRLTDHARPDQSREPAGV